MKVFILSYFINLSLFESSDITLGGIAGMSLSVYYKWNSQSKVLVKNQVNRIVG